MRNSVVRVGITESVSYIVHATGRITKVSILGEKELIYLTFTDPCIIIQIL